MADADAETKINSRILIQEVDDIIDESPVGQLTDADDTLVKLQAYRNTLRRYEILLGDDAENIKPQISTTLSNIKDYIKAAKDHKQRKTIHEEEQLQDEAYCKEQSTLFAINNLQHIVASLIKDFGIDLENLTDLELLKIKEDLLPSKFEMINKAAQKYEELLQIPLKDPKMILVVKEIGDDYKEMIRMKVLHTSLLDSLLHDRDVYKRKLFSESKLNIKLERFSGYDDTTDFYTFKSNFNKVHERMTPTELLPDLLKNNYLKEPALNMVRNINDIDEIWRRLQFAYGDVKHMLSQKLSLLTGMDSLSRSKNASSIANALGKLINLMTEVKLLAETHHIEQYLYFGDSIQRIYVLLGDSRLTRWLASVEKDDSPKENWKKLIQFLEKELQLQQQKAIFLGSKLKLPDRLPDRPEKKNTFNSSSSPVCSICQVPDGSGEHVSTSGPGGTRIIQYYTCKKFAELTPANRFSLLKEKGFCYQCLYPGADASSGKHKEGHCQHDFVCKHERHDKYSVKKHVLVCEEHKDTQHNKELLGMYKKRCIRNSNLPDFARNISLTFMNRCYKSEVSSIDENGIFLFQSIMMNNEEFTIFFDNGCSDFIVKHSALKTLGHSAVKESSQAIQISGVGKATTQSTYGTYNVKIPMFNGQTASLSGTCLEDITGTFPQYPLDEALSDIRKSYKLSGRDPSMLPKPSRTVGGEVHLMIGVKYLRYHPKLIYQLHSGLAIYESPFMNSDGGRGVIGGPHSVFTRIHESFYTDSELSSFFSNQYELFRKGISVNPDLSFPVLPSKLQKQFEDVENTGSEITYRCINCRNCKDCKNSTHQQAISIKEEMEQNVINSSITIDLKSQVITASLPFIDNPKLKLAPNKDIALKTYYQQLKKLDKNPKDKAEIIESESKLQQLGFVDYVYNLSEEQQAALRNNPIQNFIPWRVVWKTTSLSTPCRIVFDASFPTGSGYSLNDLLAKGSNNLNRLQEVFLRWSTHKIGIHTDIRKMYNTVRLQEKHWCYQRYVWEDDLNATKIPKEKVIKTLIYGIRSSGNQAEQGLREIANIFKDKYPEVQRIIHEDVYVDDCITGEENNNIAHLRAEQLEKVIQSGGFLLKGISFSGEKPLTNLTDDGESIMVGGIRWFPETDEISLNISQLNFAKKFRGKKSLEGVNIVPEKLTRRHCISKVAEIYDLTGKVAPLVASLKLDLRELCQRQFNWDDVLPNDLRQIWLTNFDMIKEIGNVRFKRAIVPENAVSMDIETMDFGDASQHLVCVCIYARFLLKDGTYSCQLVLSRTRTVPAELSLPRAELYAALLNAHTGEIVRRSFKNLVKASKKFTDSQITLHWISNDEKPLKQWVRNRVLEIQRFTSKDQWFYIQSKNMIADLGTRHGATIEDINQSSSWINGLDWMHLHPDNLPIQSAQQLKLTEGQLSEVDKEKTYQVHLSTSIVSKNLLEEMKKRYEFSQYLLDPLKHSFGMIIRIMAYVIRFCKVLISRIKEDIKIKPPSVVLLKEEIELAEEYFYRKGTREVYQFVPKSKYEKIAVEKDGILHYKGRILPDKGVTIVGSFTDVMKDLSSTSFCVPILEKSSPISYSLSLDTHWNNQTVKHCGIETTHRYVLKKAHIIEGRSLIKHIKQSCLRCRYLEKRTVEMAMGPISPYNITIAPAFYYTQLDLSGPYQSFSPQHKRTTVKIWLIVFCCCSTSAVKIKVMDDYTTTSFIQAVTRFSCDHGYPKRLLCDEGSQLVKGCKEMHLDWINIKSKLMKDNHVEFDVCPVQGHNMHGKVERKIREINLSIERSIQKHRLSLLQWETLVSSIANQINNLPLAVGDISGDFECLDLITPNRLLLGRNNEYCPDGVIFCDNPTTIIKENKKIFNAWFEIWLLVHVPKLMKQSKWFQSDSVNVGDVILFTKQESSLSNTYTFGIIKELEFGSDMLPRKAKIMYKNENENINRETYRSVRGLVVIHPVDECDFMTELGIMAKTVDLESNV